VIRGVIGKIGKIIEIGHFYHPVAKNSTIRYQPCIDFQDRDTNREWLSSRIRASTVSETYQVVTTPKP